MGNSGGNYTPLTNGILVPFTKDQIINGFNKINFSGMLLNTIAGLTPIMKLNAVGAEAIALFEKLSLTVYDNDGSVSGNATIGFGHKLHSGSILTGDIKKITFDQVSYFAGDIITAENTLNQKLENRGLTSKFTKDQYFAIVDMAYNGGNIVDKVIDAMKTGGITAATNAINNSYLNAASDGEKIRRYFDAQAFTSGRILTPEESRTELVKLRIIK